MDQPVYIGYTTEHLNIIHIDLCCVFTPTTKVLENKKYIQILWDIKWKQPCAHEIVFQLDVTQQSKYDKIKNIQI